jgi:hypothetical protein
VYSDEATVNRSLHALGAVLAARGLRYELVILGGASLLARNLTGRATGDIDVLGFRLPDGSVRSAHEFPPDLQAASDAVAEAYNLPRRWLDDRPGSDFANAAPSGFESRLEAADYGPGLRVWHLSQADIVAIKLIAGAERWLEPDNKHFSDARELGPSAEDVERARAFAERVWAPASASWNHLEQLLEALGHDE